MDRGDRVVAVAAIRQAEALPGQEGTKDRMNTPLSKAEKKDLTRFEDEIGKALDRARDGFIEAGTKLARIRDARLYRETHATFEDYCLQRWGISRPRAYQLINAACLPLVDNERQARVLLGLDSGDCQTIVEIAKADGPLSGSALLTAKDMLAKAVQEAEATKGQPLNQKEKADVQATEVRKAEERAASRTPEPRQRDRIAGGLGHISEIEGRLNRLEKEWKGEPDLYGWEPVVADIRGRLLALKTIAQAAR
jgi:hypothetical protein